VSNTSINANFVPDKLTGYAPLTINFENTSASADPTDRKMNSVWDFGNSTIQNYSTATALGSATYLQPGTYTITLTVAKGSCLNSVQKTVTVDIPSKLTIPNVFSPNNDKVNDIFFLKVVNLSSIDAKIFDRWGHKVYELITDKENANIAWDGKDQTGTDVAAGTYFYVIKATGKDGQSWNEKGTVNLFR
jgi:gliding motility-associated-like protein